MWIQIGIDLSTTKTGIVGLKLSTDSTVSSMKKILIDNTNFKNINNVEKNFRSQIIDFWKSMKINDYDKVCIGIEISNFSNAKLTQKFSLYAGLVIATFNQLAPNIYFKWFNSNQWQFLIGCKTTDERNVRKRKAKEWVSQFENVVGWEQDEIDAYCIARNLNELNSTDEIKQQTKAKAKQKAKELTNKIKIQNMVNTRLMKIHRLDKVKNQRQIETLKKEIENLGYDMENRVWK